MSGIISFKNVTKKFGSNVVLDNISLEINKGMVVGLVGRNGSGKTMLLKCLCGFVPVTSGEIMVNNKVIGKDVDIPDDMGIIIETPGFLNNYSGYDNLKFLAQINNKISKQDIKKALEMVGLDPDSKKHVGKYSLGMRQRLAIAQAIMENQDMLILDEPMNGLDRNGVNEMRKLFKNKAAEGKTIIMANHNSEDIDILCDIVCEMDAGRIVNIQKNGGL